MKIKLLILTLAVIVFSNTVYALPFRADAKTRRIPAGTKLKLQLIDPVNTVAGNEGDSFNAMLLEDQTSGANIILPAGSVVRGCVSKIKPVRRLSRGAILYLDFDHVVTPNGRQLPLSMSVYNRADLSLDGGIYGSKGYGEALKKNWARTVEITKNATQFGVNTGEDAFTGAVFITAPICAVGGAFGGGAYLVGDSVIDLFRKGDDVILNQGTVLDVMLTNPIDVPIN
ncbi:MAG: hypothetical protein WCY19_03900 [Candidatus Gastranaerophilaceae bacterium]